MRCFTDPQLEALLAEREALVILRASRTLTDMPPNGFDAARYLLDAHPEITEEVADKVAESEAERLAFFRIIIRP